MNRHFAIFNSHLDLAHRYWKLLLAPGDIVIDATCGNGYDTLELAKAVLTEKTGTLYALDIQVEAITSSQMFLQKNLSPAIFNRIIFKQGCHSQFPEEIPEESVKLIVYNLGYLPKGDKTKTTQAETTLQSLESAKRLLIPGGAISLTCYPGHPEGEKEERAMLAYTKEFSPSIWSSSHHRWINRQQAPSLLILQKNKL